MAASRELFSPASLERGKDPVARISELPLWCEQICTQKLCENPGPQAIPGVSRVNVPFPFHSRLLRPVPILSLKLSL